MDSSVVCSTEDALQAFLEHLVDPVLPAKSSFLLDTQLLPQQESVAKQVHAVGLLYNYYHRKQHPQLEFLGFKSFCKLAAILKPPLLSYMKLMQGSVDVGLDDPEIHISVTEKTIMDVCDICNALDASKDVPDLDGWPLSKVSIFLVDSKEENCMLQFSSVTQGVWSVIERDIDNPNGHNSENTGDAKHNYIMKKMTQGSLNASSFGEAELRQVAFSAVKDATGINQSDLLIMEKHVVYSCSKEKTSTHFYVMKCNQVVNEEDVSQTPIQDVIDSLSGPLLKRESSSWTTTPVVEYFHLLPYAAIISRWVSRDKSKDELRQLGLAAALANGNGNSSMIKTPSDIHLKNMSLRSNGKLHATIETSNETANTIVSPMQNENDGSYPIGLSNQSSVPQSMAFKVQVPNSARPNITEHEAEKSSPNKACNLNYANQVFSNGEANHCDSKQLHKPCPLPPKKILRSRSPVKVYLRKRDSQVPNCVRQTTSRHEVEQISSDMACKLTHGNQDRMVPHGEPLNTYLQDSRQLKKLCTLASQETILSQTALKILERKRDTLSLQRRQIDDEIAKCDINIQSILSAGEDELEIELKTLIEACNDMYTSCKNTQDFGCQSQASPQNTKRKRLNEAVLSIENACQELETICCVNNWISPTYNLSLANGTFEAIVTVKPDDLDLSLSGTKHPNPIRAKEYAATEMLAKLRSMAGSG